MHLILLIKAASQIQSSLMAKPKTAWIAAGLCLTMCIPSALGDTIVLTNGRRIDVESAWKENDRIEAVLHGVQVSYALDRVERIERDSTASKPGSGKGFTVDIWSSGMGYDAIQRLAKEHNIRLTPAGQTAGPAVESETTKDKRLVYSERLLERPAEIELVLTRESFKLYRLDIRWQISESTQRSDFAGQVAGNLVRQYGPPSKKHKRLLSSEFVWRHRATNPITLKVDSGQVRLSYLDRQLQQLAAAEQRK